MWHIKIDLVKTIKVMMCYQILYKYKQYFSQAVSIFFFFFFSQLQWFLQETFGI